MNYWQFKFKEELWQGFEKLEIGDVFTTTTREVKKLSNRIGDIVFWYRTDYGRKGIYFVSEIISEPKEDEDLETGYSIDLRILKSLVNEPFILEKNGFSNLVDKINAKQLGGSKYLFEKEDKGEELFNLLSIDAKQKTLYETVDFEIKNKLEDIKAKNISDGKMFNPFLDMNLIKGEVKHVSFVANLLNPHGTHYHGDLFLIKFLEVLNKKIGFAKDFNTKKANVITEKLTDIKQRIDLWIEDDNFIIAIEAKVESKDSFNQLNAYDKFLKKQKKDYILLYLTKDGIEPSNEYPNTVILISFKDDIKATIEKSLKESLHPKIATTLYEYHNALLTHIHGLETTWNYSFDILQEITKNEDLFKKAREIKNIYYRKMKEFNLTVVEDLAINFEKSKARIELKVFESIKQHIQIQNLEFDSESKYANIFIEKNCDIVEMKDINTVYYARRERVFGKKNDFIQISYKVDKYEILICNDINGLNIYKLNNDKIIEEQKICEPEVFRNENISQLINKTQIKEILVNIEKSINKLIGTQK